MIFCNGFVGELICFFVPFSNFEVMYLVGDDIYIFYFLNSCLGELYSVACSPIDAALVATTGGDDRGFLWKIGQGDWAFELQGILLVTTRTISTPSST